MIALTAEGSADYLRARRAQAEQARRQAEHFRRLAQVWDAQAGTFEAEVARMTQPSEPHPTPPAQEREDMAENSAISWTTHTFNPWRSGSGLRVAPERKAVREQMTAFAERDAIPDVEPVIREVGERFDVVRVQVPAGVVSAVDAGEAIALVDVEAPSLQVGGSTNASALDALAVDEAGRLSATKGLLARRGADLSSGLRRVLGAYAIARPCLGGRAHLGAALGRHRLPLHGRDEACAPFFPTLPGRFAARNRHG